MNLLQAKPKQKTQKPIKADNPLESLESIGSGITDSVKAGVGEAWGDVWKQILGGGKYEASAKPSKQSGELKPGQSVNLSNQKQEQKPAPKAETLINYHREIAEAGKYTHHKEASQMRQEVQSIIFELQRLAASSKELQRDVALATGPSTPEKAGIYHRNFFEWMLIVVRDARKRVENAGAWLKTVKSKKKGIFGSMKKNMSQYMSGERSVSNQTA